MVYVYICLAYPIPWTSTYDTYLHLHMQDEYAFTGQKKTKKTIILTFHHNSLFKAVVVRTHYINTYIYHVIQEYTICNINIIVIYNIFSSTLLD